MSDIYPTGQMDPFIRIALDRARPSATSTAASPTSSTRPLAAARRHLPELRQGRHHDRVGLGRRDRSPSPASRTSSRGRPAAAGRAGSRRSAGAAKLPWNLEWAAQWSLFGVTIEPNGKDLATAGGSRDRSNAIAREVFEREPPLNFPYEFLNIGGKKMSTSKGRGAAAHTHRQVVPPEQLRFLFVRPPPEPAPSTSIPRARTRSRACSTSSTGSRRPRRAARSRASCRPGYERLFRYSLLDPDADVGRRGRGLPAGLRPPRAARSRSPASTSARGSRPRRARR